MNINQNHGNIGSLDPRSVTSHSGSQVQSSMVGFRPGQITQIIPRKKCHGNKKLQRFRKRRRARGMREAAISKMIEARKREKGNHEAKKQQQRITTSNTTQGQRSEVSNQIKQESMALTSMKRKRDVSSQELNRSLAANASSSSYQMATVQPPSKKKLKKTPFIQSLPLNSISVNKNYPLPSYLAQSPHLIFQALSQQLNCSLNKKNEQMFIHLRLQLFDRQYRLDIDRHLWESSLNLGHQEKFWPHQLYLMAKTDKPDTCQQYVIMQLTKIKHQLDECNMELIRQARSSSSSSILILLPLIDILDNCLKEYVGLQQKHLLKRIEDQLNRYKEDIHNQKRYCQLSAYKLTSVQQQAIEKLIHLQQAQFEVYQEFIMLKQRITHQFLPPNFDQFEHYITQDDFYVPSVEDQTFAEMKTKCRKILQEGKRTILNMYAYAYQFKIKDYQQQYEQTLDECELKFTSNAITIDGLTLFQAVKTYLIHRTDHMKQEIKDKISHFRQIIARHRQRSSLAKKMVGVSPQITINVHRHALSADELAYLSRGESYIRPNQSALRPYKHRESQIQKELKKIKDQVTQQLTKYCKRSPPKAILDRYGELLESRLHLRFMAPLSFVDQMRAQREYNLVKSIRRKLRKGQLILRICDKGGGLHISTKADYERKAAEYRRDTNAYEEVSYNPLQELITNVTNILNELKDKKQLPLYRYNALVPKPDAVKQCYMYLNPKAHKEGTPLRPIMNTIQGVTRAISDLLDEIIRPIYNEHNKDKTIIDSVNLIKRLENYAAHGHLKTSTLFCTFDISNLSTMLPQDESIEILGQFLRTYVGEYVKGIPVTTIQKLAETVLKQNAFICDNKFYKQVIGGAMGSPFTLTLANIFMLYWEQRWIQRQNNRQEIYGRYIDDVLLTSNESMDIIQQLLEDANKWHPNIKLQAKIGTSLPFLDVLVSNHQGVLHTAVYHKPSAEPYVVPFVSDHPRHTFPNIIQTALVRAVKYSSTFETFIKEQIAVELMLLYNGYPSAYIDKQFRKVFGDYICSSSLLPIIDDENQFHQLRRHIMDQPTPRQSQIEAQILQSKQHNENYQDEKAKQLLASALTTHQQNENKSQDNIIIHYTHENRFTSMKRDMHEIFCEAFKGLGIEAIRLIVGNRNSPNIQRELIRKRPHMKYMTLDGSDSKAKSTKLPKE